jgi:hypothetical protein
MTQDDTAPQDRPERDGAPRTGDITGSSPDEAARPDAAEPTVTPEQDDPDREGADRFDAG